MYSGEVTFQVTIPVYDVEANTPEEAETEAEVLAADMLADEIENIGGHSLEVIGVEVGADDDGLL